MQMLSDHPDVLRVIEQLQIDPTAEMNPPEATNPADLDPNVDDIDDGAQHAYDSDERTRSDQFESVDSLLSIRRAAGLLTEAELRENVLVDDTGSTLQHIMDTFKRDVKDFELNDELSDDLYNALYDYYHDDMPYGVKKARSGDPHEWVADRFAKDLGIPGAGLNSPSDPEEDYSLERESVMHGDYAEEAREPHSVDGGMENPLIQDEGILGTVGGGLAGLALGGPLGAIAGAGLGQAATSGGSDIIEQGEEETDEGWKGQLAGGTVGTLAGTAAGAALGPVGAVVGGALGGTAGQMIGDKLGGNEEETDEGKLGALAGGAVGGYATKSVKGAMSGAKLGSSLQDRFSNKNDKSPLAGQYGHSGKMKEVGKDTSFLDRLKELSGMKK
jgi:hypothetical protein